MSESAVQRRKITRRDVRNAVLRGLQLVDANPRRLRLTAGQRRHITERRGMSTVQEDTEFGPWCEDIGQEHVWSEWEIGPYFPREERFCSKCGGMETQEIR